ncbi:MAG: hypothetical protein M1826_005135 [Phylliscum demangeonii]|nr:MAG: hypothetical protein M1826_005135 [Phylliscum demangeonii]
MAIVTVDVVVIGLEAGPCCSQCRSISATVVLASAWRRSAAKRATKLGVQCQGMACERVFSGAAGYGGGMSGELTVGFACVRARGAVSVHSAMQGQGAAGEVVVLRPAMHRPRRDGDEADKCVGGAQVVIAIIFEVIGFERRASTASWIE